MNLESTENYTRKQEKKPSQNVTFMKREDNLDGILL